MATPPSYTNFGVTATMSSVNNGIAGFQITFPYEANQPTNVQTCTLTINPPTAVLGQAFTAPQVHVFFPGNTGGAPDLNSGNLTWSQNGTGPATYTFNRNQWDDNGQYSIQIVFVLPLSQIGMYAANYLSWGSFPLPPTMPTNSMTTPLQMKDAVVQMGPTNATAVSVNVTLGGGGGA